jgi:polyisoprenoid-binding protein YceI
MGQRAMVSVLTLLVTAPVAAEATSYRVVAEQSRFTVHVGKAGLFGAFGHDHIIEVREFEGTVRWEPSSPETSEFVLEIDAASLKVADEDVSESDRAQIQADMEAKALVLADHPSIVFRSRSVKLLETGDDRVSLRLRGELDLRGETASVEVQLLLTISGGRLTATGEMKLRSDHWGVPQISAAGGTVKTDKELELAFEIVAARVEP